MKWEISRVWRDGLGWRVVASSGPKDSFFRHDTCHGAVECAQRYCDEQNAKAAETKPPEGYEFSITPGVLDHRGWALAWFDGIELNGGRGPQRFASHPISCLPHGNRWLVPAAPKKETREEAINRWVADRNWTNYEAFMRGAGFEP